MNRIAAGRPLVPLALLALFLLVLPSSAPATESVDTSGLEREARAAVQSYQQKARAGIAKLLGIAGTGRRDSVQKWMAACRDGQDALVDLKRGGHVAPSIADWYEAEAAAWENLIRIGARLIDFNERLLDLVGELEDDEKSGKAILRKFVSMSDKVKGVLGDISGKIGTAKDSIEKVEEAGKLLGEDLRAAAEANEALDDLGSVVGVLDDAADELAWWGKTLQRLVEAAHRQKVGFFDRRNKVREHRAELATLRSAKIDPDGSGSYYAVETSIEKILQDNLARYERAVESWRKSNELLLESGKEFFERYIVPPLKKTLGTIVDGLVGFPVSKIPIESDPDEALAATALAIKESIRSNLDRLRGMTWKRLEVSILDGKEELNEVALERREALDALDWTRREKIMALADRLAEDVADISRQIDAELRKLKRVPADDPRTDAIHATVSDLEEQIARLRRGHSRDLVALNTDWFRAETRKVNEAHDERKREIEGRLRRYNQELQDAR